MHNSRLRLYWRIAHQSVLLQVLLLIQFTSTIISIAQNQLCRLVREREREGGHVEEDKTMLNHLTHLLSWQVLHEALTKTALSKENYSIHRTATGYAWHLSNNHTPDLPGNHLTSRWDSSKSIALSLQNVPRPPLGYP